MARIEDLIDEIADPDLRDDIARQIKLLKSTKRFGLVFEDHVPETVTLHGLNLRAGSVVQHRRRPAETRRFQVLSVENGKATIVPVGLEEPVETVATEDLLVVKAFEEPIFPGLTSVGEVRRGPDDKATHTVINGENFHALQLLTYTHARNVDVIYIDPPYNTGARDWKYNNRFVDNNDAWRHSKWLAMMEKRLRLSQKLLKPDGVLIVTIDEHEVHHLGMLLEEVLPEARRQMVTIVNNAAGVSQGGFYRVEEYAMFCFLGDARPIASQDDLLSDEKNQKPTPIWFSLIRYGGINALPSKRPNLVYPIAVDETTGRIAGVGRSLKDRVESGEVTGNLDEWRPDPNERVYGHSVLWPFRGDGSLSTWQTSSDSLMDLVTEGFVRVRSQADGPGGNRFSITYIKKSNREKVREGVIPTEGREANEGPYILGEVTRHVIPKTVWRRTPHDAGKWGSRTLREFLGSVSFNYAKSPYAVFDTLLSVASSDAVILDFFAGSGTTLHAVTMLNARDGGNRQCILVTNNDVSEAGTKRLNRAGHFAGDPAFEAEGIFESVTKPRVEAAITGVRPDGEPVEGKYLDQYLTDHSYADGLEENVAFFRMDYLEPDLVELGRQYKAIVPLLWMAAGSVGSWEEWSGGEPWSSPADSMYAVLFDLTEAAAFAEMVESRPEISHVWVVTDSHTAFVEVREELPVGVNVGQLYRQYLRNFTVNAPGVLE